MARRDFDRWAQRACGYIYYPSDREDVKQELLWHLEDTAEALTEEGMDEAEAEAAALEAMGSADEVGKMLRRVHKPWLGWLSFAGSIVLVISIFLVLVSAINSAGFFTLRNELSKLTDASYSFETSVGHEDITPLARVRPSGEIRCGDYILSVSDGWIAEFGTERMLYLVVSYRSPRFWLGPPLGLGEFTHVVEDDGAVHLPYEYDHRIQDLEYFYKGGKTAMGEYVFVMDVDDVPDWVELRFDNGREFSLRAYIVEGGSQ